jgi:hypothetical protein
LEQLCALSELWPERSSVPGRASNEGDGVLARIEAESNEFALKEVSGGLPIVAWGGKGMLKSSSLPSASSSCSVRSPIPDIYRILSFIALGLILLVIPWDLYSFPQARSPRCTQIE